VPRVHRGKSRSEKIGSRRIAQPRAQADPGRTTDLPGSITIWAKRDRHNLMVFPICRTQPRGAIGNRTFIDSVSDHEAAETVGVEPRGPVFIMMTGRCFARHGAQSSLQLLSLKSMEPPRLLRCRRGARHHAESLHAIQVPPEDVATTAVRVTIRRGLRRRKTAGFIGNEARGLASTSEHRTLCCIEARRIE